MAPSGDRTISYARNGDVHTAYTVLGDGPIDLVYTNGIFSNLDVMWEVRRELLRFRGHEVDTAGDGFMASFDGPARAIRCAQAIHASTAQLGVEIRAGVHTGECERIEAKLGGIAVHIAARVAATAQAREVLVSQTVKDLVAGSGIAFEDRGVHELKGVPEAWRLFAVVE